MAETRTALAAYFLLTTLFLGVADYFFARSEFPSTQASPVGNSSLQNKVEWYEAHSGDYDLIFLGDSKTFCGLHPELLDPLLGTRSFNLAVFANWLPTQLALIQNIARKIPPGTTVVWSIGMVNLIPGITVQRVYPIGVRNAMQYAAWGMPLSGTIDNVLYYNPSLHVLTRRGEMRQRFVDFLGRVFNFGAFEIGQAKAANDLPSDDELEKTTAKYKADPRVADVQVLKDGNVVTSVVVYFKGGSYYRVELDADFFRRKQSEINSKSWALPTWDPVEWRMFEEILRTFKENGVKVIVSEMEEAPFMYGTPEIRNGIRRYIDQTVAPRVREFGFPYIRVDFDRMTDADYFDYNHLNSRGAQTFSPMLADKLRPLLSAQAADR